MWLIQKAITYTLTTKKQDPIFKNLMRGLMNQINVIRKKAILQKTEFIHHNS